MLIVSLVLSVAMLAALNVSAYRSGSILKALQWCCLGLVGLGFCMIMLPALLMHVALTLAAGLVCAWVAPRPRPFLATTLGAFFVAYGVQGYSAWSVLARMDRETAGVSMTRFF